LETKISSYQTYLVTKIHQIGLIAADFRLQISLVAL
jgi:hypothetical protein